MRLLLSFLFLAFCLAGAAQPLYRVVYTDSVRFEKDSVLEAGIRKSEAFEKVPEEMRAQLLERMMEQIGRQVLEVQVDVFADSSVINLVPAGEGSVRININRPRSVWRAGEAHKTGGENVAPAPATATQRKYAPTGAVKTILGYACAEYASEDGWDRRWICATLPSGINPGINSNGIAGAVLEFSISYPKNGSYTHGFVTALEKRP